LDEIIKDIDMNRTLDLTALRSFVAVAEIGGVTAAADRLHLTQSTVSMQIKRLESMLNLDLISRSGRGIELTPHGEQLARYGRQILGINDEVWNRMTNTQFEGTLVMGVPPDILYPHIPNILKAFSDAFPRVQIKLVSTRTSELKEELAKGTLDLILTTEADDARGGEFLSSQPLKWFCQRGNKQIWRRRPLPLTYEKHCMFRKTVIEKLDAENIEWDMTFTTASCLDSIPYVSAGLAVVAVLEQSRHEDWEEIPAAAGLPELPEFRILLYLNDGPQSLLAHHLASIVRDAYHH
jgi:DNA-binding transcriptional LysR family regulator